MHFRSKLFFSGTLTQNISNLDVKPNKSGQTPVNIAQDLKLFYLTLSGPGGAQRPG